MPASRLSDKEAKAFAVGAMSYGLPVNSNFFRSYFKFSKERSLELEALQEDFTAEELQEIKALIETVK